jgi:hypothetical protein
MYPFFKKTYYNKESLAISGLQDPKTFAFVKNKYQRKYIRRRDYRLATLQKMIVSCILCKSIS